MGIVVPFPESKMLPVERLTKQECDSVLAEAYLLMQDEQANGVSIANDRQHMIVFDCRGEPYFIGRENGVCYLVECDETMVVCSQQVEAVLEVLNVILKEKKNELLTR